METDEQELRAVRRLLQEATEKVQRLEDRLKTVDDQARQLDFVQEDLRELLRVLGMGDHARPQSPHEVFQEAIALAYSHRQIVLLSQKHILHVYGCAGCSGDHHIIWTQYLKVPVKVWREGSAGPQVPDDRLPNPAKDTPLECQRAYVCPDERLVVLVSNESEETYLG